jgi:hypothetical protein
LKPTRPYAKKKRSGLFDMDGREKYNQHHLLAVIDNRCEVIDVTMIAHS